MKNKGAIKITAIYFTIGFLWIIFSGRFILFAEGSPETITTLQTYKGWLFIGVTALLLFFLIKKEMERKNRLKKIFGKQSKRQNSRTS